MRTQRDVQEALSLIQNASSILMKSLGNRNSSTQNLAEGVEKLDTALAFVLGRDRKILLCPACGSIFVERTRGLRHICLSCDQEWENLQERNGHDFTGNSRGTGINAAGSRYLGRV